MVDVLSSNHVYLSQGVPLSYKKVEQHNHSLLVHLTGSCPLWAYSPLDDCRLLPRCDHTVAIAQSTETGRVSKKVFQSGRPCPSPK